MRLQGLYLSFSNETQFKYFFEYISFKKFLCSYWKGLIILFNVSNFVLITVLVVFCEKF